MTRHTSAAGWVASAGTGVLTAASAPIGGSGLGSAVLTVVLGGLGVVLGRVLWDVTGALTTRWHLKASPVDCPLAGTCPVLHPPRASSHDLEAQERHEQATKPD